MEALWHVLDLKEDMDSAAAAPRSKRIDAGRGESSFTDKLDATHNVPRLCVSITLIAARLRSSRARTYGYMRGYTLLCAVAFAASEWEILSGCGSTTTAWRWPRSVMILISPLQ